MRLWLLLTLVVVGVVLLGAVACGSYISHNTGQRLMRDMGNDAHAMADIISIFTADDLLLGDYDRIEGKLLSLASIGPVRELAVFASNGWRVARVTRKSLGDSPKVEYGQEQTHDLVQGVVISSDQYTLTDRIGIASNPSGWVNISMSLEGLAEVRRSIWLDTLLVTLMTALLVSLLLVFVIRKVSASLEAASQFASTLSDRPAGGLPMGSVIVEIDQLLRSLNAAAQTLAKQFKTLQDQRGRLRAVVNTVDDGIITFDESGSIESFNPAAVRIFGYLPQEVISKDVGMLMPPPPSEHDTHLSHFLKGGTPRISGPRREVVGRRKNGSIFPMELAVNETAFPDGRIFTGVARDLTRRKSMERELVLSRQKSETIFADKIVRVVNAMSKGDLTQKIDLSESEATPRRIRISENINTMGRQLTQFCAEVSRVAREVGTEGMLGGQALVPDAAGTWQELTDNVNAMAANLTGQVRNIAKVTTAVAKGDLTQKITVDARGEVLELRNDINTMITTLATDRDKRDRAEAALVVAREGAETASRIKSDFLANMSHEIRTPMNAILGMTHLCLQTGLNDEQRDYISKTNRSAQGLLGVINDILDFSKLNAEKLILEVTHFALHASMEHLDFNVGYQAREKELHFETTVAPDVPAYLVGDPLRLGQVLLNLTSNAVKFTHVGQVSLSVALKETTEQGVELEFRVKDTGIGLSPEQTAGLFTAFTQIDSSTARTFGGTGLGLVISKQLVELMGGRIWIESELGVGSSFCFTACFGRGKSSQVVDITQTNVAPSSDFGHLKGARILVAEDNDFNQQVIAELLEQCGAVVTLCGNGREALEKLAKDRFDVVLMDVQMPIMDGYEATREIRATPALAGQCIIAMTANAMAEDRQLCFNAGMDDFETKPVDPTHLYQTLSKWLPGAAAMSSD